MPFGSGTYRKHLEEQIEALVRAHNCLRRAHRTENPDERAALKAKAYHYTAAAEQHRQSREMERQRNNDGSYGLNERWQE